MNRKRSGPILVILLCAGVAGLFILRSLPIPSPMAIWSPPSPAPGPPFHAAPGTEMTAIKLVGRDHGTRAWEFKAGRINRSLDGLHFTAENIEEGRVYDRGEVSCAFSAGRASYEILTRRLTIGGGITGRLSDETTFTAEEIVVNLGRKTLEIPGPVKVEGDDVDLAADSLTADLAAETITLRGNAVIRWSEGTLRAAEVTYSVKDGTFVVQGYEDEGVDLIL